MFFSIVQSFEVITSSRTEQEDFEDFRVSQDQLAVVADRVSDNIT